MSERVITELLSEHQVSDWSLSTSQILSDQKSAAMNSIDEQDLDFGASQLELNL